MWADYIEIRPQEVVQYYGANPRFEDDEEFVALQAADFWAWWVRKWYEADTPEKIETEDFGRWRAANPPKGIAISFDEDQIAEALVAIVRHHIEPWRAIYDAKYFPRHGA
jgi:hypothetical protein